MLHIRRFEELKKANGENFTYDYSKESAMVEDQSQPLNTPGAVNTNEIKFSESSTPDDRLKTVSKVEKCPNVNVGSIKH